MWYAWLYFVVYHHLQIKSYQDRFCDEPDHYSTPNRNHRCLQRQIRDSFWPCPGLPARQNEWFRNYDQLLICYPLVGTFHSVRKTNGFAFFFFFTCNVLGDKPDFIVGCGFSGSRLLSFSIVASWLHPYPRSKTVCKVDQQLDSDL